MKELKNPSEEKVRKVLVDNVRFDLEFPNSGTYERYMIERSIVSEYEYAIFFNVPSPYKSPKGNTKRTEICVLTPEINVRIEVKGRQNMAGFIGFVTDDLRFVEDIPEDEFWLILDGPGYDNPYVVEAVENMIKLHGLKDKVRLILFKDFDAYLKEHIKQTPKIVTFA